MSELSGLSNIKLPYDRKLRHWKLMQHLIERKIYEKWLLNKGN